MNTGNLLLPREMKLDEIYRLQFQNHAIDQGINSGGVAVPVAAILSNGVESGWDYEMFLKAARNVMEAEVTEYLEGGGVHAVVLKYQSRPAEIWVDAHSPNYKSVFKRFCIDQMGIRPVGNFKVSRFDVDHAYCKSAVPLNVKGFIRLLLVKSSVNRSWGGYFERMLISTEK